MDSHKMQQHELTGKLDQDEYALATFRRGMLQGDEQARLWVQQSYQGTVLAWLRSHAQREAASRLHNEDFYTSQAFTQLWQAAHAFDSLREAQQYLRASLNSVILEALRASRRPASLDAHAGTEGSLWEGLLMLLPDRREQRLAYLLYNCGLEPDEIVSRCSQEFADVQEILRLRRRILVRLAHDQAALGPRSEKWQPAL
jgi:hypothetical protein